MLSCCCQWQLALTEQKIQVLLLRYRQLVFLAFVIWPHQEPEPFEGEMDDDDYVEGEFEDLDDSVFLDGDEDLDLDLIPGDFDIGLDEGDRQADPS